jgi:hypothetical protein
MMSEPDIRPTDRDDDVSATEADVYEQRRDVVDRAEPEPPVVPDDVDPADAHEQHLVVDYDEDDYR